MVWIGGPRRDPGDRLGRGRRGLYLHDPPPGYHPPPPRMSLKEQQRKMRQELGPRAHSCGDLDTFGGCDCRDHCLDDRGVSLARMSQRGLPVPCRLRGRWPQT